MLCFENQGDVINVQLLMDLSTKYLPVTDVIDLKMQVLNAEYIY